MIKYSILKDKIVHLDDNTAGYQNEDVDVSVENKTELGVVPDGKDDYFLNFNWRVRFTRKDSDDIIFNMIIEVVYYVEFTRDTTTLDELGELFRHAVYTLSQRFGSVKMHVIKNIQLPPTDYSARLQRLYFEELPERKLI